MKLFGSFLGKWHHFLILVFCMGFPIHSLPSSGKNAKAASLSMEMVQNLQETCKTKLSTSKNLRGPSAHANFTFSRN